MQRARQNGEIARRADLLVGRQAVRIDPARLGHAEVRCWCEFISSENFSTEPPTPSASTTAMSLADFTISILSALSTVIWVPGLKPILDGACEAARRGDGEQRVERDALVLDRLQRHIERSSAWWSRPDTTASVAFSACSTLPVSASTSSVASIRRARGRGAR